MFFENRLSRQLTSRTWPPGETVTDDDALEIRSPSTSRMATGLGLNKTVARDEALIVATDESDLPLVAEVSAVAQPRMMHPQAAMAMLRDRDAVIFITCPALARLSFPWPYAIAQRS